MVCFWTRSWTPNRCLPWSSDFSAVLNFWVQGEGEKEGRGGRREEGGEGWGGREGEEEGREGEEWRRGG